MRLLFMLLVGLFLFACSSKEEVPKATKEIESSLSKKTEKPPVFKDSELSNYVKEYDAFINEYIVALHNEDEDKIEILQEQSIELTEKAKVISSKLQTPAQIEKFKKWLILQQEKIKIINKK